MKRNTIIRKLQGAKVTDAQLQLVIGTIDKAIEEAFYQGAKAQIECEGNPKAIKLVFDRSYLEKTEFLRNIKSTKIYD